MDLIIFRRTPDETGRPTRRAVAQFPDEYGCWLPFSRLTEISIDLQNRRFIND